MGSAAARAASAPACRVDLQTSLIDGLGSVALQHLRAQSVQKPRQVGVVGDRCDKDGLVGPDLVGFGMRNLPKRLHTADNPEPVSLGARRVRHGGVAVG